MTIPTDPTLTKYRILQEHAEKYLQAVEERCLHEVVEARSKSEQARSRYCARLRELGYCGCGFRLDECPGHAARALGGNLEYNDGDTRALCLYLFYRVECGFFNSLKRRIKMKFIKALMVIPALLILTVVGLAIADSLTSNDDHNKAVEISGRHLWGGTTTSEERAFADAQMDKEVADDDSRWCREQARKVIVGLEQDEPTLWHDSWAPIGWECPHDKLVTSIKELRAEGYHGHWWEEDVAGEIN